MWKNQRPRTKSRLSSWSAASAVRTYVANRGSDSARLLLFAFGPYCSCHGEDRTFGVPAGSEKRTGNEQVVPETTVDSKSQAGRRPFGACHAPTNSTAGEMRCLPPLPDFFCACCAWQRMLGDQVLIEPQEATDGACVGAGQARAHVHAWTQGGHEKLLDMVVHCCCRTSAER